MPNTARPPSPPPTVLRNNEVRISTTGWLIRKRGRGGTEMKAEQVSAGTVA